MPALAAEATASFQATGPAGPLASTPAFVNTPTVSDATATPRRPHDSSLPTRAREEPPVSGSPAHSRFPRAALRHTRHAPAVDGERGTRAREFVQILELQRANLAVNLSAGEARAHSFVTAAGWLPAGQVPALMGYSRRRHLRPRASTLWCGSFRQQM